MTGIGGVDLSIAEGEIAGQCAGGGHGRGAPAGGRQARDLHRVR